MSPSSRQLNEVWDDMKYRVEHAEKCKDPKCNHNADPPSRWEMVTVGRLKMEGERS